MIDDYGYKLYACVLAAVGVLLCGAACLLIYQELHLVNEGNGPVSDDDLLPMFPVEFSLHCFVERTDNPNPAPSYRCDSVPVLFAKSQ